MDVTFHNLSFPTFFHSNMSLFTICLVTFTATCHFPQLVISNFFPQQHVTFHNLSCHFFSNMSLFTICHFQHFSTATCHFSQFGISNIFPQQLVTFQQHVTFHNLSFPTFSHSNLSLIQYLKRKFVTLLPLFQ